MNENVLKSKEKEKRRFFGKKVLTKAERRGIISKLSGEDTAER